MSDYSCKPQAKLLETIGKNQQINDFVAGPAGQLPFLCAGATSEFQRSDETDVAE